MIIVEVKKKLFETSSVLNLLKFFFNQWKSKRIWLDILFKTSSTMETLTTVKEFFMNLSTKQKMALVGVFGFGISGYYIHKNAKLREEA